MADRLSGVAAGVVLVGLVAGVVVALGWSVLVVGGSALVGLPVDSSVLLTMLGRFLTLAACAGLASVGLLGLGAVARG